MADPPADPTHHGFRRVVGVVALVAMVTTVVGWTDAGSSAPSANAAAHGVGIADSLVNVRPGFDPAGLPSSAHLVAARNEFESFQIVVRAGTGGIGALRVSSGEDLTGPSGAIPAANVTIYREAFYDVTGQPSDAEGALGKWPDPLIPERDYFYREDRSAFPVSVAEGETVAVWVDILVPRGSLPGTYAGTFLVKDGASAVATVDASIDVLPFILPSTPALRTALLTQYNFGPCKAHTANSLCGGDADLRMRLHSLYARAGLENRVTITPPLWMDLGESPGTGQAWLNRFDTWALPLLTGGSPVDDDPPLHPVRLAGARLTSFNLMGEDCKQACQSKWLAFATDRGFAPILFDYACDEPNASTWPACIDRLASQNVLPKLVTTTVQQAETKGVTGSIDVLAPVANHLDNRSCCGAPYQGNQRPAYNGFLQPANDTAGTAPNELWFYTSCMSFGCEGDSDVSDLWKGWPGHAIDQPASQARAAPWMAFLYDTTGYLSWQTTWKLDTAWTNQYYEGGHGDGTLFYPGTTARIGGSHDIPVESIRLKRLRDGIEDHGWLRYLEREGSYPQARAIVEATFGPPSRAMYCTTVPQPNPILPDCGGQQTTSIEQARTELAELIRSLPVGEPPSKAAVKLVKVTPKRPRAGRTMRAVVRVTAQGRKPTGKVRLSIDGHVVATVPYPASVKRLKMKVTAPLVPGKHIAVARFTDAAGNHAVSRSAPRSFKVRP